MQYERLLNLYEEQFISSFALEYTTEAPAIVEAPINFIKKTVLFMDQYIQNLSELLSNYKRSTQIQTYLNFWRRIEKNTTIGPTVQKTKANVELYRVKSNDAKVISDYTYQYLKNVNATFKVGIDDPITKDLHDKYLANINDTSDVNRIEKVPFDEFLKGCEHYEELLKEERNQIVKQLLSIKGTLAQIKDKDFSDLYINNLAKVISALLRRRVNCITNDMETAVYAIRNIATSSIIEMSDRDRKEAQKWLNGKMTEKQVDKMLDRAEYVRSWKINGAEIKLYKIPIKVAATSNYGGTIVVAGEEFFNYPRSIQNGILFHEFGHYVNGHFGPQTPPDEKERIEQLKKRYQRFCETVRRSKFRDYFDDNEFVYLMCELEADQYSASQVGKYNMKKSIRTENDKILANLVPAKDVYNPTDDEIGKILYNKERMRIRNALV